MPFEPVQMDTSPEAMAELHGQIARRDPTDIEAIEDQLGAHVFAQECKRQWDEEERLDRTELISTEVLEVVSTIGSGALSTVTAGSFPLGSTLNVVVGFAAKAGSLAQPKNRALRVACNTGKVLLHSQLAIITRGMLLGAP